MRYLGNKSKLLENFIVPNIKNVLGDFNPDIFFDVFTGTGSVGEAFKDTFMIYGCDLLYSSYLVAKAKIELNQIPEFETIGGLEHIIKLLHSQNKKPKYIYQEYSEGGSGGRLYFSAENGKSIDSIISMIHYLKKQNKITDKEFTYLYLMLIDAVHSVANTTGVFGAFLKELSGNAKKNIQLEKCEIKSSLFENRIFHGDSYTQLQPYVSKNSVLYIDPPYNNRQYGSNYHLLETICTTKKPNIKNVRGKPSISGLPVDLPESDFCKKDKVETEFRKYLALPAKYIFISYNSESILTNQRMLELLSEYGKAECIETEYKRFKSNENKSSEKNIMEYLYILRKNVDNSILEDKPINNPLVLVNIDNTKYNAKLTLDTAKMINPIIQWAGGKRRLLPEIMKYVPDYFKTYYEPFLGGGSLLFELQPTIAYATEINPILVATYQLIKNDPLILINAIDQITTGYLQPGTDRKDFYLKKRSRFNELKGLLLETNKVEVCAIFLFLNKTGFNAVYRENKKGVYNVPFGNGKDCSIYNQDNILNMSNYLKNVVVECASYKSIIDRVKRDDFVYMDPPYYETFTSYSSGGWSLEDTQEVIKMFKLFVERGARVILSNNNHPDFIKMFVEIFPDKNRYDFVELTISRTLNSNVAGRGQQKCELLVVSK